MPARSLTLILTLMFSGPFSDQVLLAQVYDSPKAASEDPDFEVQGEYADSTRGLQVIAMGDGEFQVVMYTDGLPAAGWNGKDKQTLELDIDQVDAMLNNFKRVNRQSPTLGAAAPRGSVVLFDGTQASLDAHWKAGAKITDDGLLMQGCTSKDVFGDYTMHIEFRTPFMPAARGQARGNSGLYHQGRFETQMLDSFGLEGEDNETGGIYGVRAPDSNMCLPPLTWQTYDVDFTAARFDDSGKKTTNAKLTVKLNGVIVHRDVELPKTTSAAPLKEGPEEGPIYLQDHGNPVRYRNIWVRPRDLTAEAARPIVPGFERFHATGGNEVEGGRLLLGELNCTACHAADESLVNFVQPKQAPILDGVGERVKAEWMIKYIANPHAVKAGTTMPDLLGSMTPDQRQAAATALTHFLVGKTQPLSAGKGGNSERGKKLFHESGCIACHLPRNGKKVNAATSIPLTGIDNKYSRGSLAKFLQDPHAVRPSGRMPKLPLKDAELIDIAQYLTGDKSVVFGNRKGRPKNHNMKFSAYFKSVGHLPDLSKMKPDLTGVSRGLDIGVAGRDEGVIIRFESFLPIKTAGDYSFRLSSDDGSRLFIDDKLVIDNDGVHDVISKEISLELQPGSHAIRVDWFENSGGEKLELDWAGPDAKSAVIDKFFELTSDGSSPPAPTPDLQPKDKFVFDAEQAKVGRRLFSKLGCAACHERTDGDQRIQSDLTAPALAKCDPVRGCLAATDNAPQFDLVNSQVDAIASAISVPMDAEPDAAAQLTHTMKSLNCYACHQRDGVGGAESDRNQLFISTIPEMGDEGRLPPPLNGVGDKLREDWIKRVVSEGDKSRPYMKTYMPKFGAENVQHLAPIFAALDSHTEASITQLTESPQQVVTLGRKMVGSKGLACVSCHTYDKFKSSGIQAIGLDTMTSRIREDWFHRYLPNPQKYRPGTRMPTGYPNGKSTVENIYDGDQGKQLSAMWAFLSKGSAGGVPEGIVGGMKELKPTDKPVLYRNFIEGVSPRGIAVGYPEKANLCWDANTLSLALIWQDRFIDASKHWDGRGKGKQTPLGGSVTKLEATSPIAELTSADAAWPTETPKERGYKFLGYQVDAQGRPTFRYRANNVDVEDKPIPVSGKYASTFKREIKVTPVEGTAATGKVYFRAAQGDVKPVDGEWYAVGDHLKIRVTASSGKPFVRNVNGNAELLVPVSGNTTIVQEIVW